MTKKRKKRAVDTVTYKKFRRIAFFITSALIIVIILTNGLYAKAIFVRNEDQVSRILKQYEDTISGKMEEYKQLIQTAAYDAAVGEYLQKEDVFMRHQAAQKVSVLFSNLKMVQNGIVDFFVFRTSDKAVGYTSLGESQRGIMQQLWQISKPEVLGLYPYAPLYGQLNQKEMAIIIGCPVFSLNIGAQASRIIGAVAVAISRQGIELNLKEFYQIEGIKYGLINQQRDTVLGEPLSLSQEDWNRANEKGNFTRETLDKNYIFTHIPAMNGVMVVQTDKWILLQDFFTITLIAILMAVMLLFVMLFLFGHINKEITGPLASLTKAVEHMDTDPTHDRHVPEEGNEDFLMLSSALNQMLATETQLARALLEASRNLYASELTQKHLELQFLRSQINPHFLYNTLETIRSISLVHKVPQGAAAAKHLAKILRYSIKGPETMPLSSEIEIIQCYLAIQQLRFGSRITTVFDIDDEVKALLIPRMCLQPLIENAIIHGLETSIGPGKLTICCHKEGNALLVIVKDTGSGIPLDELNKINYQLANPFDEYSHEEGLGMLNVARRLHLSLGRNFVMELASELGSGTQVLLRIPLDSLEKKGGEGHV